MAQTKGFLLMLVAANVIFGIIPVFVVPLLETYQDAIFMVVFIRFSFSSIIIFCIVFIMLIINRTIEKNPIFLEKNPRLAFFKASFNDLKHYITSRNKGFFNKSRLLFLFILGFFGVTINVSTYLIGLQELSVVFMLVGAPGGLIIMTAIYNTAKGKERFTLFKGVYLALMILALVTTTIATGNTLASEASLVGFISLVLNIIALFFMFVYMSRDVPSGSEDAWKKRRGGNFHLTRGMLKLAFFQLFGALSLFLLVPVGYLTPGSYLAVISKAFLNQWDEFWIMTMEPGMIILITVCTSLAFFLLFLPSSFWDATHALTLEQWNAVLYLADPIAGTAISVLVGLEVVDTTFLALTIIILSIAILLRYVHERDSRLTVLLFINAKFGHQRDVLKFLSEFPEIRRYFWITGLADIMIIANLGSIGEYYAFMSKIGIKEEIKIKFDHICFFKKCF